MLEGKKTKISGIAFGVSGSIFIVHGIMMGFALEIAFGIFCFGMMFFAWGIYDRLIKTSSKQTAILDKGLFITRPDGTKVSRIKKSTIQAPGG